ncbi:Ig-like domain-containing protein [Marinagarivorans algicola]|uniref:Ig-like domain-containing protein n=1 Tax=Marinagarivorans algicola TaxID=1513270 RepID=UPI0006B9DAAA|nr:Ig-like domain-containing protein [Marinagarivorans algicola]
MLFYFKAQAFIPFGKYSIHWIGGIALSLLFLLPQQALSQCGNTDTDGDNIFDLCDWDDDNDGILDLIEGCQDYTGVGPTADGVEDTGFPEDYWSVTYFDGWDSIPGSSYNSTTAPTFTGEAYLGFGQTSTFINIGGADNVVLSGEDYTVGLVDFVPSTTPTNGTQTYYQVVHRRTASQAGNIAFGGDVNDRQVDDAIRIIINGVTVFNHFPGSSDPRPGPSVPVSIAVNAGDEIEVIFVNLGGQGGYAYTFTNPVQLPIKPDSDNDGIADCLDIDSDNDSVPDNVEAQLTSAYITPTNTGVVTPADVDSNGVPTAYSPAGLSPIDTDRATTDGNGTQTLPDYLDSDSDGDGIGDAFEAGSGALLYIDTDGDGLDDGFEGASVNDSDINDELDSGAVDTRHIDNRITAEVDFRELFDTDGDSITDRLDLDDDNDGITDVDEGQVQLVTGPLRTNTFNSTTSASSTLVTTACSINVKATATNGGILTSTPNHRFGFNETDGAGYYQYVFEKPVYNFQAFISSIGARDMNSLVGVGSFVLILSDGEMIHTADFSIFPDVITPNSTIAGFPTVGNDVESLIRGGPDVNGDSIGDYLMDPNPTSSSSVWTQGAARIEFTHPNVALKGVKALHFESIGIGIGPYASINFKGEVQCEVDTDADGLADHRDGDSDNDSIPDSWEAVALNTASLDSNGDGFIDVFEAGGTDNASAYGNNGFTQSLESDDTLSASANVAVVDYDGDTLPDFRDLDSDNDAISDLIEAGNVLAISGDTDNNGQIDITAPTNGLPSIEVGDDGIADIAQNNSHRTPVSQLPLNTDGDTETGGLPIPDYRDLDTDNDGIPDLIESANLAAIALDTDGDGQIQPDKNIGADGIANDAQGGSDGDPLALPINSDAAFEDSASILADFRDLDSDNDGLNDTIEAGVTDTNADGLADEADADDNGLADAGAVINPTDSTAGGALDYQTPQSDGSTNDNIYAALVDDNTGVLRVLTDNDGDGIANSTDSAVGYGDALDTDQDGLDDARDADDDNDGILDIVENANALNGGDTDGDGLIDSRDLDSDNDGLPDNIEAQLSSSYIAPDNSGVITSAHIDTDGIPNAYSPAGLTPIDTDRATTDGDGSQTLPDYLELDSDNDGFSDFHESGIALNADVTDLSADRDNDGLLDVYDTFIGFDINNDLNSGPIGTDNDDASHTIEVDYREFLDTDNDGIAAFRDLDDDNDGILDSTECAANIKVIKPSHIGVTTPGIGQSVSNVDVSDLFNLPLGSVLISATGVNLVGSNNFVVDGSLAIPATTFLLSGTHKAFVKLSHGSTLAEGEYDRITSLDGTTYERVGVLDATFVGSTVGNAYHVQNLSSSSNSSKFVWQSMTPATHFSIETTTAKGNVNSALFVELSVLADNDLDGLPNCLDRDSDNDSIPDSLENTAIGRVSLDSNGDGLIDITEAGGTDNATAYGDNGFAQPLESDDTPTAIALNAPYDSDGDTLADYLDLDSDNDAITDLIEGANTAAIALDADANGQIESTHDVSTDGIADAAQGGVDGSAINNLPVNTDIHRESGSQLLPDYRDLDTDSDGIPDLVESGNIAAIALDSDSNGQIDLTEAISLDGVADAAQGGVDSGPLPNPINSDAASEDPNSIVADFRDLDSDNDGLNDSAEAGVTDTNEDGLADGTDNDTNGLADTGIAVSPTDSTAGGPLDYQTPQSDGATNDNTTIKVDAATGVLNTLTDTDGDGIPDIEDTTTTFGDIPDNDRDGIRDAIDLDDDNDGITDVDEDTNALNNGDTDGDGVIDRFDLDSDNDGIPDTLENTTAGTASLDADLNGVIDITEAGGTDNLTAYGNNGFVQQLESDDTTAATALNAPANTDADGLPDYLDLDADSDGIPDLIESGSALAMAVDTNNDAQIDHTEAVGLDGIADSVQGGADGGGVLRPLNSDNVNEDSRAVILDYRDLDSDNDGINDVIESGSSSDIDGNGLADGIDLDNNGLIDTGITLTPTDTLAGGPLDYQTAQSDGAANDNNNATLVDSRTGIVLDSTDTDRDGIADSDDSTLAYGDARDTDNDGIIDAIDYDDDNDGILDTVESTCVFDASSVMHNIGWDPNLIDASNGSSINGNTGLLKTDRYQPHAVNTDGYLPNAPSLLFGPGLVDESVASSNFVGGHGYIFVSGATEGDADSAKAAGDYIEFGFTTSTDTVSSPRFSLLQDVITYINGTYRGRGENISDDSARPIYADFTYQIEISADNFNSSVILTSDKVTTRTVDGSTFTNTNPYDTGFNEFDNFTGVGLALSPGVTYRVRLYLYAAEDISANGFVTLDNFRFNVTPCHSIDSDGDGLVNSRDIDSDNDGIPDNVEAQVSSSYIPPSNNTLMTSADVNSNGIPFAYGATGLVPIDTDMSDMDGDGSQTLPDYLDSDSDNDGIADAYEAGAGSLMYIDTDGDGLDDGFEGSAVDDGFDVNDQFDSGAVDTHNLANTATNEVDFREAIDSDNDGVTNRDDLDNDNDGIPDSVECQVSNIDTTSITGGQALRVGDMPGTFTHNMNGDALSTVVTIHAPVALGGAADLTLKNQDNLLRFADEAGYYLNDGQEVLVEFLVAQQPVFEASTLMGQSNINQSDEFIFEALGASSDFYWIIESSNNATVEANGATLRIVGNQNAGSGGSAPFAEFRVKASTVIPQVKISHINLIDNASSTNSGRFNFYICADSDGDGLLDAFDLDSDNDGIPDAIENVDLMTTSLDRNADGVISIAEAGGIDNITAYGLNGFVQSLETDDTSTATANSPSADTDGDGIKDYLDLDSDNDAISDLVESGNILAINADADSNGRIDTTASFGKDGIADIAQDGDSSPIHHLPLNIDSVAELAGQRIPDYRDLDTDNDGIPDLLESGHVAALALDTDGNGQIDPAEAVGNDGIADAAQGGFDGGALPAPINSDAATEDPTKVLADFRDLDSDNDGLNDSTEAGVTDSNDDGLADGLDNNNDGLADTGITVAPTDTVAGGPLDYQTPQSDGVTNDNSDPVNVDPNTGVLSVPIDTDGDGIPDTDDTTSTFGDIPDNDLDGVPDALDADDDNDGIPDVDEIANAQNTGDTDGDGIADHLDLDADNDGIPDSLENVAVGVASLDSNADGVISITEAGGTDAATAYGANGFVAALESDDSLSAVALDSATDTDGDLLPDYLDLDSDNDAISDLMESGNQLAIAADADSNGQIDSVEPVGNEGLADVAQGSIEGAAINTLPADSDNDGVVNYRDLDADNDGLADLLESGNTLALALDTDTNGQIDVGAAVGNDGIADLVQGGIDGGVLATAVDTDADSLADYLDLDSDNDAISDLLESGNNDALDTDGNGQIDITAPVGVTPSIEVGVDGIANAAQGGTDTGVIPAPQDTDNDGLADRLDLDTDNDGIPDLLESGHVAALALDTDGNGQIDPAEAVGNDGIADAAQGGSDGGALPAPINSDAATEDPTKVLADFRDLDSDNDGLNDSTEAGVTDSNDDGLADGLDNNNDGLADTGITVAPTDTVAGGPLDYQTPQSDGVTNDNSDPVNVDPNTGVLSVPTDTDGDGIPDTDDTTSTFGDIPDNDRDGVPDALDVDDDNDGIPDVDEIANAQNTGDTDGDGIADHLDLDADNDGIPDSLENVAVGIASLDSNADGVISITEAGGTDAATAYGANGFVAALESDDSLSAVALDSATDTDGDLLPDYLDLDSDNDAISDLMESGSLVFIALDIDNDGKLDSINAVGLDGIVDAVQSGSDANVISHLPLDTDSDRVPDYRDFDADNDGISDQIENTYAQNNGDTDNDNILDFRDLDSDADGLPDNTEAQTTSSYIAPSNTYDDQGYDLSYSDGLLVVNSDNDGLPDYLDRDSDNDTLSDTQEAGLILAGVVGMNGWDQAIETMDDYNDVNGTINTPNALPNNNNTGDIDYREDDIPTVMIQNVPASTTGAFTATLQFSESVTGFTVEDILANHAELTDFTVLNSHTYAVTVAPNAALVLAGSGTITLDIANGAAQDASANSNIAALQALSVYDNAMMPSVTIADVPATITGAFTATLQFSENVAGFSLSDVTATNAELSDFIAVDGDTYTVLVTPHESLVATGTGNIILNVDSAVAQDAGNSANSAAQPVASVYDNAKAPEVVIQDVPATTTRPFAATVQFSEAVTGFELSDITAINANLSNFIAVDGDTYIVDVEPNASLVAAGTGTITLDITAAVAQDAGDSDNLAARQALSLYDNAIAPQVSIENVPITTTGTFTATLQFSEAVTGFAVDDIAATNASLTNFTAINGTTYTVDVTPDEDLMAVGSGSITLDIAGGVAQDAGHLENTAAVQAASSYSAVQISINTIAGDDIINALEDDAHLMITGTATNVEDGQAVTVSLNGKTYTGIVTDQAWSVTLPAEDAQALGITEVVTADVSNLAGDTAESARRNVSHTVSTPLIGIDTISGDDIVNALEDDSPVTITGTTNNVEAGQTVTVGINDVTYTTTVSEGRWSIVMPASDAQRLDMRETVVADVTNIAQDAAPQATRDIQHTVILPSISLDVIAGDDTISAIEDNADVIITGSTANVESNQTVQLVINDKTYSGVVTEGTWAITLPAADAQALAAIETVVANVANRAGDAAVPARRDISHSTFDPAADADGDGLPNLLDGQGDSDGDGIANYLDPDSDNDGIPDGIEAGIAATDSNNNGIDDAFDAEILLAVDSDGDGLADLILPLDSDGDTVPDYLDLDSDNDEIPDVIEVGDIANQPVDTDGDGDYDFRDRDSDGDRLADTLEAHGSPLLPPDSDNDGLADFVDVDSDGDGILDTLESLNVPAPLGVDTNANGLDDAIDAAITGGVDENEDGVDDRFEPLNTDGDDLPDYLDLDSDNDGITDQQENQIAYVEPTVDSDGNGLIDSLDVALTLGDDDNSNGIDDHYEVTDTDGDGVSDFQDLDSDNDGLPDNIEGDVDTDGDGLSNYRDLDSDNDSLSDALEAGDNPAAPRNSDGDNEPDYLDLDSDNDHLLDSEESSGGQIIDSDSDGVPNHRDGDSDNDGITDLNENAVIISKDSDGDGIADRFDADANNDGLLDDGKIDVDTDGINDAVDADINGSIRADLDANGIIDTANSIDSDGDAIPNVLDIDSDNDGVPDLDEVGGFDRDFDGDGRIDGEDINGNGVVDTVDNALGQLPLLAMDTDGDGRPDLLDLDSDGDGLTDLSESGLSLLDPDGDGRVGTGSFADNNGNGLGDLADPFVGGERAEFIDRDFDNIPDTRSLDSDGDGISDLIEAAGSELAQLIDPDGDGKVGSDGAELLDNNDNGIADSLEGSDNNVEARSRVDADQNGVPDVAEQYLESIQVQLPSQPVNPISGMVDPDQADFDRDGYPDVIEVRYGGDPLNGAEDDRDGDGIPDWVENTDIDGDGSSDSDNDGFNDLLEQVIGTDLLSSDTTEALFDAAKSYLLSANRYEGRSVKPVIWIDIAQAGDEVINIAADNGAVSLVGRIGNYHVFGDPRDPDTVPLYSWSSRDTSLNAAITGTHNAAVLMLDPSALAPGLYTVTLSITLAQHESITEQIIEVVTTQALRDSDADRHPDIADDHSADMGYLTTVQTKSGRYLNADSPVSVEGRLFSDKAVRLRAGQLAQANRAQGIVLTQTELNHAVEQLVDRGYSAVSPQDTEYSYQHIYDYEVINLPYVGASARIIIPLNTTIPTGAVLRKYAPLTGWQDFTISETDNYATSTWEDGKEGVCPIAGSNAYRTGLNPGHECLQLTIIDGGLNDGENNDGANEDGQGDVNGLIKDPIAIGLPIILPVAEEPPAVAPVAVDKGEIETGLRGGGAWGLWSLWLLLCLLLMQSVIKTQQHKQQCKSISF